MTGSSSVANTRQMVLGKKAKKNKTWGKRNPKTILHPSGNLRTWKINSALLLLYCSRRSRQPLQRWLCGVLEVSEWWHRERDFLVLTAPLTPRSAQRCPANVLYGGCVCCAPRRHICSDMGTRASWRWQMRTPTPASERAYLRLYFKNKIAFFIFFVHFHYSLVVWFVQLATCGPAGFCTMCMWTLFQRLCWWNWIQILFQKFRTLSQRFGAVFRKSLDLFWGPFPKAFCSAALVQRHAMA